MSDPKQQSSSQPDANLAADEHPRPSQAEGDLETIEQDLAEKEKSQSAGSGKQ